MLWCPDEERYWHIIEADPELAALHLCMALWDMVDDAVEGDPTARAAVELISRRLPAYGTDWSVRLSVRDGCAEAVAR